MPSARQTLRTCAADCLSAIRTVDGYQTDAGLTVTLEPGQIDRDDIAVIALVIGRQSPATQAALVRTHRLTTLDVYAKVPASMTDAQARLDALISDIERAMANTQFKYPVGIQFPQYVEMLPIPTEPGMNWTGALVRYTSHIPIH